jgi:hypothetical protein
MPFEAIKIPEEPPYPAVFAVVLAMFKVAACDKTV